MKKLVFLLVIVTAFAACSKDHKTARPLNPEPILNWGCQPEDIIAIMGEPDLIGEYSGAVYLLYENRGDMDEIYYGFSNNGNGDFFRVTYVVNIRNRDKAVQYLKSEYTLITDNLPRFAVFEDAFTRIYYSYGEWYSSTTICQIDFIKNDF